MNYKTTIDFKAFYKDEEEFNQHLENLAKEDLTVEKLESQDLKSQLDWYYSKALEWEKLYSYNEVNSDLHLDNQKYIQNKEVIGGIKTSLDKVKNYIDKEILEIDLPLDEYLRVNPELQRYYMVFYNVMQKKKHPEDSILFTKELPNIRRINSLYNTLMNVEFPAEEVIINGERVRVSAVNYVKLMTQASSDEKESLAKAYFTGLSKIQRTISGLLNMRYQIFYDLAEEAGYSTILEHTLGTDDLNRHITDNILRNVSVNLEPLAKYYSLRKEVLGLEKLHFYDGRDVKDEKKVTFDEAISNVLEALSPLGPEYLEKLRNLIDVGVIDVYPRENKYLGGYHFRNYTQSLIVMNSQDRLKDSYTIAHELGHAVNTSFIKENHPYNEFHFASFLSEVASLTNEVLMEEYYLKEASTEEEKILLLEQKINKFIANVYSSMMWFEFEDDICEAIKAGKPRQPEEMSAMYAKLYIKYNPGIEFSDYLKYGYMTRLHYFMGDYRYYNFQYATGILMATKLANDIKNNVAGSLDRYLEFLKLGGSLPTLEALKVAGLDLTDDKIIADGFRYFSKTVDEYQKLVLKKN